MVSSASCSGCFTGSRRSRTWSTSEKMAVLAPIPAANESTAMTVKRGDLRNSRAAKRSSAQSVLIEEIDGASRRQLLRNLRRWIGGAREVLARVHEEDEVCAHGDQYDGPHDRLHLGELLYVVQLLRAKSHLIVKLSHVTPGQRGQ